MDENRAMQLKKYDHVWLRVTPDVDPYAVPAGRAESPAAVKKGSGAERLLEKMAQEAAARDCYLSLAKGGSGLFRRLAAEESRHIRALGAMYFLLAGELPPRQETLKAALPEDKRQALRERYREECLSAQEYAAMAECMQGDAAEMLRALAKEEQSHAAKLRRLLEQFL